MMPTLIAIILACCKGVATEDDRPSLVGLKVEVSEDRNVDILCDGQKAENDHVQLKHRYVPWAQ
jgi:hypothetical protein